MVACLLVGSVAAPGSARPPQERRISAPYMTPAVGARSGGNEVYFWDCLRGIGCGIIQLGPRDRSVKLEIIDDTGGAVHAEVYTMPGGSHYFTICGKSETYPVYPGSELLVHVIAGTCDDGTPSTPTHGTIEATVSSKRV